MILTYPHPALRRKSKKIERWTQKIETIAKKLGKELLATAEGVGLSAPQIGVNLRLIALKTKIKEETAILFFVNPQIISHKGKKSTPEFLEGCLSFPGLYGKVRRYQEIEVEYQTPPNLEKHKVNFSGFWAVVLQHEIDHLNGILFIDRLRQQKGKLYRRKNNKLVAVSLATLGK